jgi:hypothetical protein
MHQGRLLNVGIEKIPRGAKHKPFARICGWYAMVQGIIFKSLPEELNSAKITLTQAQDE